MKEEVGMKRRGALGALAGWVVVGVLVCSGTSAFGQAEDIYENIGGLTWNGSIGVGGAIFPLQAGGSAPAGFSNANATYNPNGIGQYLFGQYYDVRAVDGDAQVTNFAIVNTNTNNANLPTCTLADVIQGRDGENCYFNQSTDVDLPKGGILAKVRFRESRYSSEVLDFNIVLSCGEVWTARLELGADGFPSLISVDNVVTSATGNFGAGGTIKTKPAFNPAIPGGAPGRFRFPSQAPGNLVPADAARGYMEVIGIADLPCEPVDADGNTTTIDLQNGNTWNITANTYMATNALAAEALLVRTASGNSYGYPFDAISRYRPVLFALPNGGGGAGPYQAGTPSVPLSSIFGNETPNINDCLGFSVAGAPFTGPVECVRQFNLALHKGRLVGQYDISPTTAGKTNFVITLPTKYRNCNASPSGALSKAYPQTPFACVANPGEEVTCTVYDRLENLAVGGFTSPSETERCFLPRELTIFGLPGSINADDLLAVPDSALTPAGWVAIELDDDQSGQVLHREIFPDPSVHDILGGRVQGYRGLPALGIKIQEYENGNVGGSYGAIIKMQADDPILMIGQS
jgi:hypothetical protein